MKGKVINFLGVIINTSLDTQSTSVDKSLDITESSFININFISDNLFLKAALDLLFRQSNFSPHLISWPNKYWFHCIDCYPSVGPSKRTLDFPRSL